MRAYPHQLSGGQQQRVVIAMALLSNPRLLILDEPTTALDVTVEAGIVALVKDLTRRSGASSLFISHNLGLILETCDSVTVMYSGEAVETGKVRDVFGAVRHPYTQGLFRSMPMPGTNKNDNPLIPIPGQLPLPHERPKGCNFGPRCPHFVPGLCDQADVPMREVAGKPGHWSRCLRVEAIDWSASARKGDRLAPVRIGAEVLEVDRLKKHYRVAASALFGRRRGAHGQGGRGRLLRRPRSGGAGDRRRIGLRQVDARQGAARARDGERGPRGVRRRGDPEPAGRASSGQDDRLAADDLPESVRHAEPELFGRLADPAHARALPHRQERAPSGATSCCELLDLVKLPRAFARRSPRQLSGGQKQRIGVARAFAGRPRVIVADEPMSALDVSVQAAISELLMNLQRESKTTMVFISHDLSVVRYLADRVVVMYLGHIVEMGATEQIFSPPFHPYTEALLSAIPIADATVKKRHVVLEGEIPSALSPPKGCPFQTRCGHKGAVAGNLCEREVPPIRTVAEGHTIKCHLPVEALERMEPVFS